MITHLIKSINWIDVALVLLLLRMIFLGVKNGFICEFCKSLGTIVAVFVSLHCYSYFAAWVAHKTHFLWAYWDLVIFAALWFLVALVFKFLGEGLSILFKAETNHPGFDKYAAGIVAVGRGILVCSLSLFLLLLVHHGPLSRAAFSSYSYKISGRAAVSTYSFLYNNLVGKLFAGERYNAAAALVMHP